MNFDGPIPHGNCGLRALAMALPKGGMLVLSVEFDVLANNPMTQATAAERKSPLLLMPVLQVAQQNLVVSKGGLAKVAFEKKQWLTIVSPIGDSRLS